MSVSQTKSSFGGRALATMPKNRAASEETLRGVAEGRNECDPRVRVSAFDDSAENHFRAMERISELCGEVDEVVMDESEVQRLSSSITFLREWRLFNYEPREVKFACEVDGIEGNEVLGGNTLHQFSSATVPKEGLVREGESPKLRDFVMYAGGPVWGLDWCPRVSESADSHCKCEFIAISAHPPGASYHKIGVPLSGRGLVQIWAVLNVIENEDRAPLQKPKREPKIVAVKKVKKEQVKRPRGRPRKNLIKDHVTELDGNGQDIQLCETQVTDNSFNLLAIEGVPGGSLEDSAHDDPDKQDSQKQPESTGNLTLETTMQSNNVSEGNKGNQLLLSQYEHDRSGQDPGVSCDITSDGRLEVSSAGSSIPDDVALPRVVLCLAHNGKVVWDVKWRPSNADDSTCRHRMGYLAVLLGDGSLEVWEIPLPRTIRALYSSLHGDGTDPRFVKLKPVFRCSMLKSGGVQSIPLTVEWSPLPPHEFLLAGCHDGTVALWKFSASFSSKDTRPLLCFSADTAPIRAIAWAPVESDSKSENVILTAGLGSLKFWDIRDPYCPLWELQPSLKVIYSLDWLLDPRCVIFSFDDGTMRLLSLSKAANDSPVTGKPFSGSKQLGLHTFYCSSDAIWSVQVSRPTGMVAYCGADGTVFRFQLTEKAVNKDSARNRAPHFPCGSLTENNTTITINTPLANALLCPMKKFPNRFGDTPTPLALRDVLSESNHSKKGDPKRQKPLPTNDQPLAICYGDDPEAESETDTTIASLNRKKPQKCGSSSKKNPENSQVVPVNDEPSSSAKGKFEVLPSKNIAMHRVRWNMNKGSERWLCSGGAAGIVRCQEIVLSDIEKKWAIKK